MGRRTHWEEVARRAWTEAPVQAVDLTEADPWVPSEVVVVAVAVAVVAVEFVAAVAVSGVVVVAEAVAPAVVVVAAAAAAAVVAAAAAAAPQGSASYVGACDPGVIGHFLVMSGANNRVSHINRGKQYGRRNQ